MCDQGDYLLLSGIQHFYFCKRQWALIHLEQRWQENESTSLGKILHEKADQPYIKEARRDYFISRSLPVSSSRLRLTGLCDIVEFHKSENGIELSGKKGRWQPNVVEYKKGKAKKDKRDRVQLIAQVMALEEEFKTVLEFGYLYYFQTKEKKQIGIKDADRQEVTALAQEMHKMYQSREIPPAEYYKNCTLCSLYDLCMPRNTKKKRDIERYLYGE